MTDKVFTSVAEQEAAADLRDWVSPPPSYQAVKNTHRLCKRCQFIQTANPDQICDSCSEKEPYREFYPNSNQQRSVDYVTMVGHEQPLWVRSTTNDGGMIAIPYLTWRRAEDGHLSLLLDNRLGFDLPTGASPYEEDSLVEFIANAIAIGAGYASIYYTKRKMPFRG